uniref:Uncharacterized protein n=1 Tax=viral metagenome TaxID=1070528 RepID=A0A6C0K0H3_9ZZZZ
MKWSIIVLLCIAIVLLIADRLIRIQPYVEKLRVVNESFQMPAVNARKCGVNMLPCMNTTKCGNGFCISTEPPVVIDKNPLPVLP